MRETLHAAITLEALGMAVQRQPPAPGLIRHAQQGQPARVRAVPEGPRRGRDHALHEPQGASPRQRPDGALLPPLKVERVHHRVHDARAEARRDLFAWIEGRHNTHRLHSAPGYRSPAAVERMAP